MYFLGQSGEILSRFLFHFHWQSTRNTKFWKGGGVTLVKVYHQPTLSGILRGRQRCSRFHVPCGVIVWSILVNGNECH